MTIYCYSRARPVGGEGPRPYAAGGEEYSGRVATPGAPRHYDVAAQRTATRVLSGALNPAGGGRG